MNEELNRIGDSAKKLAYENTDPLTQANFEHLVIEEKYLLTLQMSLIDLMNKVSALQTIAQNKRLSCDAQQYQVLGLEVPIELQRYLTQNKGSVKESQNDIN